MEASSNGGNGLPGAAGYVCEEAAKTFCHLTGLGLKISPCPSIIDCAESVEDLKARFGIVPLENSLEGSVHDTLEILTTSHQLRILAELDLNIEHCLLSRAAALAEIKRVYSHPQALLNVKILSAKTFACAADTCGQYSRSSICCR